MILDTAGVAAMFHVKRETVHTWRRRRVLPEPAGFVSDSPYWERWALEIWGIQTGRKFADKAAVTAQEAPKE